MKTRCNYPRCTISFKRSTFRVPDAQRALVAQLLNIRLLDSLFICELHFWTEAFARRGLKPALRKDAPFFSLLIMPNSSQLSQETPKLAEVSLLDTLPRPIISVRKAFANWNAATTTDSLAIYSRSSAGSSASSDVGTIHSFEEESLTSSLQPDFTSSPRRDSYLLDSKFEHLADKPIKLESHFQFDDENQPKTTKTDQDLNVESNLGDPSFSPRLFNSAQKRPRHETLSEPEESDSSANDSDGSWLEGLLMPPCSSNISTNNEPSAIEESSDELRFDDFF